MQLPIMTEPKVVDITLPFESSEDETAQKKAVGRKLKVSPKRIQSLRLVKHSLDARRPAIKVQLRFEVGIDSPLDPEPTPEIRLPKLSASAKTVIIVGSGPAGLFAALRSLQNGWKPIVIERGKDASARRYDLAPILRKGTVIEDSNYCFGEGGAGTFSDGKLYTHQARPRS